MRPLVGAAASIEGDRDRADRFSRIGTRCAREAHGFLLAIDEIKQREWDVQLVTSENIGGGGAGSFGRLSAGERLPAEIT